MNRFEKALAIAVVPLTLVSMETGASAETPPDAVVETVDIPIEDINVNTTILLGEVPTSTTILVEPASEEITLAATTETPVEEVDGEPDDAKRDYYGNICEDDEKSPQERNHSDSLLDEPEIVDATNGVTIDVAILNNRSVWCDNNVLVIMNGTVVGVILDVEGEEGKPSEFSIKISAEQAAMYAESSGVSVDMSQLELVVVYDEKSSLSETDIVGFEIIPIPTTTTTEAPPTTTTTPPPVTIAPPTTTAPPVTTTTTTTTTTAPPTPETPTLPNTGPDDVGLFAGVGAGLIATGALFMRGGRLVGDKNGRKDKERPHRPRRKKRSRRESSEGNNEFGQAEFAKIVGSPAKLLEGSTLGPTYVGRRGAQATTPPTLEEQPAAPIANKLAVEIIAPLVVELHPEPKPTDREQVLANLVTAFANVPRGTGNEQEPVVAQIATIRTEKSDKAVEDMLGIENILDLKDQLERRVNSISEEQYYGVDRRLDKDGSSHTKRVETRRALKESLIDNYTQLGVSPEAPRVISEENRQKISDLLDMSFDDLEAKI